MTQINEKELYKRLVKLLNNNPEYIKNLSINSMKENFDNEDYWDLLFKAHELDNDFIKECYEELNLKFLFTHQNLDDNILLWLDDKVNIYDYIDILLDNQTLPNKLILKYIDITPEPDWYKLALNQILSEDILEKYIDKWDWGIISQEQFLKLKFIIKYSDKINWRLLPLNIKTQYLFNDTFVEYFCDKPFWDNIGWMDKITLECIFKFKQSMTVDGWLSILEHKNLDTSYIVEILDYIPDNKKTDAWVLISNSQLLDDEFIDKFHDKLNWKDICLFHSLNWDMIKKYHNNILLKYLSHNDCMNNDLAYIIKENASLFSDELDDKNFDKDE